MISVSKNLRSQNLDPLSARGSLGEDKGARRQASLNGISMKLINRISILFRVGPSG